jgi:hypothetical protein
MMETKRTKREKEHARTRRAYTPPTVDTETVRLSPLLVLMSTEDGEDPSCPPWGC